MDLKVAAFLHCKSFSWKLFWLPLTLKNNENLSKRVVVFFFFSWQTFLTDLGQTKIVSPAPFSLLRALHASTGFEFHQPCPGAAKRSHSKFHHTQSWTHPKLPQRTGISSLDVLLHWGNNLWRVLTPKVLSFCSKICRTQSSKFFWTSWMTGRCRFPIPNPFHISLNWILPFLFFISLFSLQLCDTLLFRKPLMNLCLDISKQIFAGRGLKGAASLWNEEKWLRFL